MNERSEPAAPSVCYRHTERETYISCQRCGKFICPDCMRSAAVGFQCPDCVKEGARSTRSGLAAFGGRRSADPQATSLVLVGMNVAVWLLVVLTGYRSSPLVDWLALLPDTQFFLDSDGGVTEVRGVAGGAFWQLVTAMFTHVEAWHIGFNALAIWQFGPRLESILGRARFLAVYLLSGLAGNVLVYCVSNEAGQVVGASTAGFGLIAALLVLAKKGGEATTATLMVVYAFAFTFLFPGISWAGHIGGFLGGLVTTAAVAYAPRGERRSLFQWGALGVFGLVLLLLVAARTYSLT